MTYGVAQQSGGHVRLVSQEGEGTTVKMYFPRCAEAFNCKTVIDVPIDLPIANVDTVVLVVEDDPRVRQIIVEVISDLGYSIIEAVDGPSGLHVLGSGICIDLLNDRCWSSRGMNGPQLAEVARQQQPIMKVLYHWATEAVVQNRDSVGLDWPITA